MTNASFLRSTWRIGALALVLAAGCSSNAPGGPGGGGDEDDPDGAVAGDGSQPTPDGTIPPLVDGGRPPVDAAPPVSLKVCATGGTHRTIGAAVAAATPGSTIEVCAGTFIERVAIQGKPLTLRGAGAGQTIIDGGGAGPVIGVTLTGGSGVIVEGVTVRNGANGEGAGVRCEQSTFAMSGSVVEGNRATAGGGGLWATGCALAVKTSRFVGNTGGERGGGLYVIGGSGEIAESHIEGNSARWGGGVATLDTEVLVRGNEIRGNYASSHGAGLDVISDNRFEGNTIVANNSAWTGGGAYLDGRSPTFAGNVISDNVAANDGGGVYIHFGAPVFSDNMISNNTCGDDGGGLRLFTSKARLERNQFLGNKAPDGDGGGVKISHDQAVLVDNNFVDNESGGNGGAVEMDNDSSTVTGGMMSGNRAGRGGGIHGWLFPWRGALIRGVVIVGNHGGRGGGIYLQDNFYGIVIRDVTVVGNDTRHGGGIYISRTQFTLSHSIIANNVSRSTGGGLVIGALEDWQGPWIDPCPCPPPTATGTVDFVTIHGNKSSDAGSAGGVWTDSAAWSMENSIISGNLGPAQVVVAAPKATPENPMPQPVPPEWRWNDTMPATFVGMGDPTGSNGNLAVDPLFVNAAQRDFQLQAGSACINAGDPALLDADGSRADMGRFGGIIP